MTSARPFYSKVLLFGEYAVIQGSQALAIPYTDFCGKLEIVQDASQEQSQSNRQLDKLCRYFTTEGRVSDILNLQQMLEDLRKGLFFNSNIPQGYGLGSSGALIAALYHQYSHENSPEDLISLRSHLSRMESFIHGSSSGLDPLVSFFNRAVYIKSKKDFEVVDVPSPPGDGLCIFLLDCGFPRQTSQLVNKYLDRYKEDEFRNMIHKHLIPANHRAIDSFLSGDYPSLMRSVKEISLLEMRNFKPMIEVMLTEWLHGIESNEYFLKLCGAGGGGYILGFAPSHENVMKHFRDYRIIYQKQHD